MKVSVRIGDRLRQVELDNASGGSGLLQEQLSCTVDTIPYAVDARMSIAGVLSLLVGGRQYRCTLDGDTVVIDGNATVFELVDSRSLGQSRSHAGAVNVACSIKAPMPGRVVRVLVSVGDQVDVQQGLVVIEAMKMQNELRSPRAGRVARVAVVPGDTVQAGGMLVVVE